MEVREQLGCQGILCGEIYGLYGGWVTPQSPTCEGLAIFTRLMWQRWVLVVLNCSSSTQSLPDCSVAVSYSHGTIQEDLSKARM